MYVAVPAMAKPHQQRVPLRQWMESEAVENLAPPDSALLRRVAVAYGIVVAVSETSQAWRSAALGIDNFAVRTSGTAVEGVDMLCPTVSIQIAEPSFLGGDGLAGDPLGRFLEAEVVVHPSVPGKGASSAGPDEGVDESGALYAVGRLLHELFSHGHGEEDAEVGEPARKRRAGPTQSRPGGLEKSTGDVNDVPVPLRELGLPPALSLLVGHLVCGPDDPDAYDSLAALSSDLHLLLLEPGRFLFNTQQHHHHQQQHHQQQQQKQKQQQHDLSADDDRPRADGRAGGARLLFRREKLYGRQTEVAQIHEAFCRVSTGRSEAFFIGKF